jgi:hypothetical protein
VPSLPRCAATCCVMSWVRACQGSALPDSTCLRQLARSRCATGFNK